MCYRMEGKQGSLEGIGQEMIHEQYFELCALVTTGSLTDGEWKQLKAHLSQCGQCSNLIQKYRDVAQNGIPLLIKEESLQSEHVQESWSPELAERELLARIARGEQVGWSRNNAIQAQRKETKGSWAYLQAGWQVLRYAAPFVILAIAIGFVYRFGVNSGWNLARTSLQSSATDGSLLQNRVERLDREKASLDVRLAARNHQFDALSKQLETATADLAKLNALNKQVEQDLQQQSLELLQARTHGSSAAAERDAIARSLNLERTNNVVATANLENRIDDLSARLRKQDELNAMDAQLLTSDRDIRELMGARDLYIADVFDVDSSGRTQRPFGRVFYTRASSLIFYAFDLDRQRGVRNVSAFQAWGRRGPRDDHPVNMGIFYLDSETNRRWVLKFDDPNTLARIDTVFVTVEPKGGSREPRGKAFLVASLRSQPNHP